MDTIAQVFLAEIEAFLANSATDATALGKLALGDPSFVFDLRKGRSPSTRTIRTGLVIAGEAVAGCDLAIPIPRGS